MVRPQRVIREEGRVASAWALSIVGHLVASGLGGLIVAHTLGGRASKAALPPAPRAPEERTVEIELPTVADGTAATAVPAPELPPEAALRGGGDGKPALDTGHNGRGGTDTAADPATNLADRDDGMFLSPEVASRFDRNQI